MMSRLSSVVADLAHFRTPAVAFLHRTGDQRCNRGARSGSLFSYVDLEARVRRDHRLRAMREITNEALAPLTADFDGLYWPLGCLSVPPERLLWAMLLQAFYGIRSERQLMEQIEFDLLFHWLLGLGVDDPAWDHSSFSTNRDWLLEGEVAAKFLRAVLARIRCDLSGLALR